jgi:ABC-type nickel/cobalt efflux system permease component RcnA
MNWLEVASLLLMPLAGLFMAWYLPRQLRDEQLDRERRGR